MMKTGGQGDPTGLVVMRAGTWVCAAGLVCWLLDLAAAVRGWVRAWCGGKGKA
jgi:hypothetical protein